METLLVTVIFICCLLLLLGMFLLTVEIIPEPVAFWSTIPIMALMVLALIIGGFSA